MSDRKEGGLLSVFVQGIVVVGSVSLMFGGYKALFKNKEEFFRFCTQYFWVWWSFAFVGAMIYAKFG